MVEIKFRLMIAGPEKEPGVLSVVEEVADLIDKGRLLPVGYAATDMGEQEMCVRDGREYAREGEEEKKEGG
ncbi:hypothetical protein ES705_38663 [subsurface metagenome]